MIALRHFLVAKIKMKPRPRLISSESMPGGNKFENWYICLVPNFPQIKDIRLRPSSFFASCYA